MYSFVAAWAGVVHSNAAWAGVLHSFVAVWIEVECSFEVVLTDVMHSFVAVWYDVAY